MSTIVLATDFSPSAKNAADYCLRLAAYLRANVELLHAYVVPFAYTDTPLPLVDIEEISKLAEEQMEDEMKRLRQAAASEVALSSNVLPGEVIDCLNEFVADKKPLLVVLGTSGESARSVFWGSVAVKALRGLRAPVLAIPKSASWRPVGNICFAADYEQISDRSPIEEIVRWTQKMNALLDVVHVDKPEQAITPPLELVRRLQSALPVYHALIHETLEGGVQEFIQERKTDWLLIIPKKYGFFENIFHKSRTKILTQICHVPVLSLHQE